ncbi:pectate lyase family protein [Sorangium sp. So ce1153]|uniref:pectate lyase family protein n=1 Tax=Sorangium sp. So ce1153 TaxID=3133333 RepID=UPI003F63DB45
MGSGGSNIETIGTGGGASGTGGGPSIGTGGSGGGFVGSGGGGSAGSGGGGSGGSDASGGSGDGGSGGSGGCPTDLMGWAAVDAEGVNGTTGGGDAAPTTVTTFSALKAAAQDPAPRVIIVSGTIDTTEGGGSALEIKSNKTIQGANSSAKIYGGLSMKNVSNVIIRNLNIQGVWPNSGPDDTLASRSSHHIWYDHLNVWDAGDGLLDITNASDYQTVSWSKFWYTNPDHGHRLASLNGSGGGDHPEDWDHLRVTYHHNWWAELVDQRMPRVMYGKGHVFNNYFNSEGNSYCVGAGSYGAVLVEGNYFKDVNDPHTFMYDVYCHITARDNVYDNTTGKKDTGLGGNRKVSGQDFNVVAFTDPPYDYTMDAAADVPDLVTECAGSR